MIMARWLAHEPMPSRGCPGGHLAVGSPARVGATNPHDVRAARFGEAPLSERRTVDGMLGWWSGHRRCGSGDFCPGLLTFCAGLLTFCAGLLTSVWVC